MLSDVKIMSNVMKVHTDLPVVPLRISAVTFKVACQYQNIIKLFTLVHTAKLHQNKGQM